MTLNNCNHEWEETYTGFKCKLCEMKVPDWFFGPLPDERFPEPESRGLEEYDFGELG